MELRLHSANLFAQLRCGDRCYVIIYETDAERESFPFTYFTQSYAQSNIIIQTSTLIG